MKAPSLDASLMTMRVLWGAMTMSTLMFAGIEVHLRGAVALPPPPPPTLSFALTGAGAVVAVVSLALPRWLYAQAVATRGRPIEGAVTDAQLIPRVPLFMTPFILSLALSEAVSLFGFVIGRTGGELPHALALMGAGTLLVLLRFPSRGALA